APDEHESSLPCPSRRAARRRRNEPSPRVPPHRAAAGDACWHAGRRPHAARARPAADRLGPSGTSRGDCRIRGTARRRSPLLLRPAVQDARHGAGAASTRFSGWTSVAWDLLVAFYGVLLSPADADKPESPERFGRRVTGAAA